MSNIKIDINKIHKEIVVSLKSLCVDRVPTVFLKKELLLCNEFVRNLRLIRYEGYPVSSDGEYVVEKRREDDLLKLIRDSGWKPLFKE